MSYKDMKDLLHKIKEHKKRDPEFKKLRDEWVKAEAELGSEDPVEGKVINKNSKPKI